MHPSALDFGQLFFKTYCANLPGAVVHDVGAQNINGSLRDVLPPHLGYAGIDFVAGNGVDIILQDPYRLPFADGSLDVLVCSSCFEHSQFFWLVFLEMLRVLKPQGLLYLNAPSNGSIHRYPVDCWRFYPDSGHALEAWAARNGYSTQLMESFVGARSPDPYESGGAWHDFVAVFVKDRQHADAYPARMLDVLPSWSNGFDSRTGAQSRSEFLSPDHGALVAQEHAIVALHQQQAGAQERMADLQRREEESARNVSQLREQVAQRDQRMAVLTREFGAHVDQLAQDRIASTERMMSILRANEELMHTQEDLRRQAVKRERTVSALECELAEHSAQMQQIRSTNEERMTSILRANEQLMHTQEDLRRQAAERERTVSALERELAEHAAQMQQLRSANEAQIRAAFARVEQIKHSRSWRFMAPARKLMGALRVARSRVRLLQVLLRDAGGRPDAVSTPVALQSCPSGIDAEVAAIRDSGRFDPGYYLAQTPALANVPDPVRHYCETGWREGRNPSPGFDTNFYLKNAPDIAAAGMNPFLHYVVAGAQEGRSAHPAAAGRSKKMLAREVDEIRASGQFDEVYYRAMNADIHPPPADAIRHYCERGWLEGRNPSDDFDTRGYLAAYRDIREAGINPFWHYVMAGKAECRGVTPPEAARAIEIDSSIAVPLKFPLTPPPSGRLAAIVHLYHEDLAGEMRTYLEEIPSNLDVYLSTRDELSKSVIEKVFNGWSRGTVEVRVVPNRGRDIAPKLLAFRDVYGRHEYVLHLHGKRSRHASILASWRHYLLESLCGSADIVKSIMTIFDRNPEIGMIAAQHFEPMRHWVNWGGNFEKANQLACRMGFEIDQHAPLDFPSGSMFWARAASLRPLLDLNLSLEEFDEENGQVDATLAHAIERLYFYVCEHAGYNWVKIARPEFAPHTPSIRVLRKVGDLDTFFRQDIFHLLDPCGVPPRTVRPQPVEEVTPQLGELVRERFLGTGLPVAPDMRVTIGLLTYNNSNQEVITAIAAARIALERAGVPVAGRIFLLDNGNSTEKLTDGDTAVTRLMPIGNVGFGAGHNHLMHAAFKDGAALYIAVNPDGVLHPDAVIALVQMVEQTRRKALVEALQFPAEHPKPYDPFTFDTPWVSGACLAIPKGIFEELGGFDDEFFMYCEDVDLSWRARAYGYALKTCPRAWFLHAVTNRMEKPSTVKMIFDSGVLLARKWGSPEFESWLQYELTARGFSVPTAYPETVPEEWRRYADFSQQFSFAQTRW